MPGLRFLAAVLVAVPLVVASPAAAAPAYTITVGAAADGPEINDRMYGVFFEDINSAADGGLYAELVRNRSFEFRPVDNPAYTALTGWSASGTVAVAEDEGRMNERNRTYLRLSPGPGVTNDGYYGGIAVDAGSRYDFSVWARGEASLAVTLHDATGRALARPLSIAARGDTWTQYTGTFRATAGSDAGRLTVSTTGAVGVDMVSLFPRDTFRGRPNGLRRDLAQKIAALHPGFVRFPGGCLVNTGSMYGYDEASGYPRARAYQWKETVGPVETRATNANFWGYNQSYGVGYYEYFQFAEDVGAMPLPVVPALVTGCGQNRATEDEALLQRHIQDTLDLIEFANGPTTSTWGALRASMGHPRPFGLTHVAVGNEENLPEEYFANFLRFRAAISAAHPEITVIGNTGPDDQGVTFDRLWALNRQAGTAMVDEHYYNSPSWFLQNNRRYDAYDRAGPKVFLGEYASQNDRLFNALSEAAYMTGLERNADVVRMASYAPLLAHVDNTQWTPDMIYFDNNASWGSASYQVQKLFMNNVGDRVVPSRATGQVVQPSPITGSIGLSTWATAARYDDVRVTAPAGAVLFSDDFSSGAARWSPVRGNWSVVDGAYTQTDTAVENALTTVRDLNIGDYDMTLTATKTAGNEGFLIAFGVKDSNNLYWWNLGGWNNTQGAVEKMTGGAKEQLFTRPDSVEAGRTYNLKISVRGTQVQLFVDGALWGSFADNRVTEPFAQVVTQDDRTGELVVKVVNAQSSPAVTAIDLGGRRVAARATQTVIAGDPQARNTATSQPVAPVTTTVTGIASTFTHTFPANSVTFLRLRPR